MSIEDTTTMGPGWAPFARIDLSPNFDLRPEGQDISLIVMHYITLPEGQLGPEPIHALFCNELDTTREEFAFLKGVRVSSHFLIERSGAVFQFVDVYKRAWHAGVSNFLGRNACNNFSVGIELEGTDDLPFTEAQYESLRAVLHWVTQTLPIRFITGHQDIAPNRKTDPGPYFDWARLAQMIPKSVEIKRGPGVCDVEKMLERARELSVASEVKNKEN